jgi:hypothetical protein
MRARVFMLVTDVPLHRFSGQGYPVFLPEQAANSNWRLGRLVRVIHMCFLPNSEMTVRMTSE